jgi:hypothetical protein
MALHDPDTTFHPFIAHNQAAPELAELPEGWDAAKNWRKLKDNLPPRLRQKLQEAAIDAVLRRAQDMLRHAARPLKQEEVGFPEEGELDLEATFEHSPVVLQPEEIRLFRRVPREAEVVAILDMSLSMTGEKIALIALATTILRLKLEHVAVVAFDTTAHRLVRVGSSVGIRELIRRILEVPAHGYTNIEAGLQAALAELKKSRLHERVGFLLTDGVANVGWNPVRVAGYFPRLHVVHLGDHHPQGARCCRELATAGRGKLYRASHYAELPGVVRRAVREVFKS